MADMRIRNLQIDQYLAIIDDPADLRALVDKRFFCRVSELAEHSGDRSGDLCLFDLHQRVVVIRLRVDEILARRLDFDLRH